VNRSCSDYECDGEVPVASSCCLGLSLFRGTYDEQFRTIMTMLVRHDCDSETEFCRALPHDFFVEICITINFHVT